MVRSRREKGREVDAVDTEGLEVIEMLLNPLEVASEKLNPCCCISSPRGIFPLTWMGPLWNLSLGI